MCIVKFDTDFAYKIVNGNVNFIWKTQTFLEEAEYEFSGTIKDFSEFHGEKQTVVTRCKTRARTVA